MRIAITIFFIFCTNLFAKEDDFVSELVGTNFGNEFMISMPPNLLINDDEANSKIRFVLYSPMDAVVKMEVPLKGFSESITLKAYERKVVNFDIKFAQVLIKDGFADNETEIFLQNAGLRFHSEQIFGLVVLSDYANTSDAILALPTEMLGTDYIISSYQDNSDPKIGFTNLPSSSAIIATSDKTQIDLVIGGRISNSEPGFSSVGKKIRKKMNKGDVLLLNSQFRSEDLSGTIIKSDKPVSIISSNQCAQIPSGNGMCDFIADFEIPKKAWGKNYLVPPIANKKFMPVIRVFALDDSTHIYKNGEQIAFLDNIGNSSQKPFIEIIDSTSLEPIHVSSNNKIKVVIYSRGFEEDESSIVTQNPFMTSLQPLDRMQKEVYFTTPNSEINNYYFPDNNYLNLIINDSNEEISDSLEIGIIYNNEVIWEDVASSDYVINAQSYSSTFGSYQNLTLKLPVPWEYKIRSKKEFQALVYGTNNVKSYGYPASFPLAITNIIDTIPPEVTWEQSCSGLIKGKVTDETIPLGTTLLSRWENFKPNLNVSDKSEMPVTWHLEAIDPKSPASATISFWDGFKNRSDVFVNYQPVDITISPDTIDLGNMKKGNVYIRYIAITNNSDSSITFDPVLYEVPVELFDSSGDLVNSLTIERNSSVQLQFSYFAEIDTSFNGNIVLENDCLGQKLIYVKGKVSSPIIEVSDVILQDIPISSNRSYPATIKNTGAATLEIYGYDYPSSNYISIRDLPEANSNNPYFLDPGKTIDIEVEIDAERVGDNNEFFVVRSNATEIDSILEINYRVVNPGLVAEGISWSNGKIDANGYEFGPFENESKIIITNTGNVDLQIFDYEIVNELHSESFIFEEDLDQLLIDRKLPVGSSFEFNASFDPTELDSSRMSIRFQIGDEETANSVLTLKGFGTRPKAKLSFKKDYNTFIGINEPITGNLRFENLSRKDWKYTDIIENFNLEYDINLANEIGFRIGGFLDEDIQPGDFVDIPISFLPKKVGKFELPIKINTEAILDDYEIVLEAEVTDLELKIDLDRVNASACQGMKDTISVEIQNLSDQELILDAFRFDPPINNFSIIEHNNQETELEANGKINLKIEYTSLNNDVETDFIVKIKNQLKENRIPISGNNKLFKTKLNLFPDKQEVKIGSSSGNMLSLTEVNEQIGLKELYLEINFNGSFVDFNFDDIFINDNYANQIGIEKGLESKDKVKLSLFSLDNSDIPLGEDLIGFTYRVLLPSEGGKNTQIEISAYPIENSCLEIDESGLAEITVLEQCDESFRRVTTSGFEFYIDEIVPNPLDQNKEINFGIGVEANTKVSVYNSNGEIVAELFDSFVSPGNYSFILPVETLPNGVYFLKISALDWSETIQFIISK